MKERQSGSRAVLVAILAAATPLLVIGYVLSVAPAYDLVVGFVTGAWGAVSAFFALPAALVAFLLFVFLDMCISPIRG